ncbi:MAG: right-handed parallel beta-helix repeat-containing protein, partial [Candidatus Kapaibacteriota bacterium]
MKKIIMILIICFLPHTLLSQSIISFNIPKDAFKLGESFLVSVRTDTLFNASNFFIVQISDKFGSFSSAVEIGRIAARADTTIPCQIPDTFQVATNYLIRVLATSPSFISNPHPSRLILYYGRTFYVSKSGNDDNDGSRDKPLLTIQKAIDIAWYHDTIYVEAGTYNENIKFNGIDLVLLALNGPEQTIIDGLRNGTPVVTLENGESSATVIDGFTIQNGVNYQMDNGPGITIKYQNTAPTLRNLIIKNNEAWAFGGGIFCYNAGNVKIINCKIENNKAKYFGGGIYTDNTNIELISSIVRKNSSGGIYTLRSFPKINNSLIYWNNSNEVTIFSDLGFQIKPQILNSTIVSSNKFYAVYIYGRFYAQILNSIIYGPDSTIYLMGDAYDTLEVNHSIVYEYPKKAFLDKVIVKTGKHFFTDDPMFINLNNENFSLDSCSAAIGTADKTIAPPFDVFEH